MEDLNITCNLTLKSLISQNENKSLQLLLVLQMLELIISLFLPAESFDTLETPHSCKLKPVAHGTLVLEPTLIQHQLLLLCQGISIHSTWKKKLFYFCGRQFLWQFGRVGNLDQCVSLARVLDAKHWLLLPFFRLSCVTKPHNCDSSN